MEEGDTDRYNNETFQLTPAHERDHFEQAKVEVRQHPDGTVRGVHPALCVLRSRRVVERTSSPPPVSSAIIDMADSLGQKCGLPEVSVPRQDGRENLPVPPLPQYRIGSKRVSPSQGDGRGWQIHCASPLT